MMDFSLRRADFLSLGGWATDDPSPVIAAMGRCARYLEHAKSYKTGKLGVSVEDLMPAFQAAKAWLSAPLSGSPKQAREFFEAHFDPFEIVLPDQKRGFLTAYYEPEVEVRLTPDDEFRFPFYTRPPELIDLEDHTRPPELDSSYMFARLRNGRIDAFPDRREIDQGYLQGRNLEIAWARSKVDVFFIHVQGAARLLLPDGTILRITYTAKAGHPFSAIGRHLITLGEIDEANISMGSIRAWLADHPQRVDEILWHNRSYIFFKTVTVDEPHLGPVGAAKVQLIADRSIAVDRLIHTFGMPFFLRSSTLTRLDDGKPFEKLMLALDTGTAIVGPARADIFTGSGKAAGDRAGSVRNEADFCILIPKTVSARFC
jgi:membrane-bound lytic murein transglycosylase A